MARYECFVRHKNEDGGHSEEEWYGSVYGPDPEIAASNLAVEVEGYNTDNYESAAEIVEQFINDGWRFRLVEVEKVIDNTEVA